MQYSDFELLVPSHDRSTFDCGNEILNNWIKNEAIPEMEVDSCKCYVSIHLESQKVSSFYSLSACQIPMKALPENWAQNPPKYPSVPAVLIGRMATAIIHKRKGLASRAVSKAAESVAAGPVGAYALFVHSKDDTDTLKFYRDSGFIQVPNKTLQFYLPIKTYLMVANEAATLK